MKQIKITASINKALETLADLIEGKLPDYKKPNWGWKDVRFIVPSEIEIEDEMTQDYDINYDIIEVPTGYHDKFRKVSFWLTNEFHLATIHLIQCKNSGWQVNSIETAAEPQYGCRG